MPLQNYFNTNYTTLILQIRHLEVPSGAETVLIFWVSSIAGVRTVRVMMAHGPKTPRPTLVNGGLGVSLSAGRSAVFWSCNRPRSLWRVTHLESGDVVDVVSVTLKRL